jgi:hypothetical protein
VNPQPYKNWFLKICAGIIAVSVGIIYIANRPSAAKAPALQTLRTSNEFQTAQRPLPQPKPSALPTIAAPMAVFKPPTPPPTCQPCEERWGRYRQATEAGLGKDDYRDYSVREIPQAVPPTAYSPLVRR